MTSGLATILNEKTMGRRKTRALRAAMREQTAADKETRAAWIAKGLCPCGSDAEDPGPHIPFCPWLDPDFEG